MPIDLGCAYAGGCRNPRRQPCLVETGTCRIGRFCARLAQAPCRQNPEPATEECRAASPALNLAAGCLRQRMGA